MATATAPSGVSACCSRESATAWVSAAASAPLSASRIRTAGEWPFGDGSSVGASVDLAAVRKASATSESRSRAAWLMTSTASSSVRHPGLLGEFGELAGGLCGPAPQPLHQDALGEFDQGTPVGLGLGRSHLAAQPVHRGGEPAHG